MEQNLNSSTEAQLTTSAVGFGNTLLAVVSLPSEVEKFMTDNKLEFGKWYSPFKDGRCHCQKLTDFVFHNYWGWQLVFHTKVKYTIESRGFTWFEVSEPKTEMGNTTFETDNRKELDKDYYKLKSRHELLCRKKLELMRQGKNTTMRNAYINQELEMLRSQLSGYRSS